MKVLVIDGDTKNALYVRNGLSEHGYIVDVSHDGDEALELARALSYDLVIMDVVLGERDGWPLLIDLTRAHRPRPILVLSSLRTVEARVKGLRLADDYLTKPFAFSELLVRSENLLRRKAAQAADIVRVADLEVQPLNNRATRRGRRLNLTVKEFQLLSFLARRPGAVFSRSDIIEHLWGASFCGGSTNLLDAHVRRLRSKVDDPFEEKLIYTVRGLGYVLEERPSERS